MRYALPRTALLLFTATISINAVTGKARGLPSYKKVTKILKSLWAKRYPIKPVRFISNPANRGVLSAVYKRRRVHYYQYKIILPRPVRNPEGKIEKQGEIIVETWVRYRSWKKQPYDITFAREDILPGRRRRWYKYIK